MLAFLQKYKLDSGASLVLLLIGLLLFVPMVDYWKSRPDAETHNQLAQAFIENPSEFLQNTPHFLYHAFTGTIAKLTGLNVFQAGAVTMLAAYLALMLILYWQFRRSLGTLHPFMTVATVVIVLVLLLIAPIFFFTPDNLYLGYFPSHVYHNPTINLMKPFAVLLFFAAWSLFGKTKDRSWLWAFPYALLTTACLLAKPSFILAFIPALGLFTAFFLLRQVIIAWRERASGEALYQTLWRAWCETPVNWTILLAGITLPSFAILYLQSITWTSSGGIGIDPFRVFFEWSLHYDPNANKQILLKFFMSCLFPLVLYALYFKAGAWKSSIFNLAWLTFLVSAAYGYLLVDYTIIAAGDFVWTAQIGAFILFIGAGLFYLQKLAELSAQGGMWSRQALKLSLATLILSLHLVAGFYWYYLHLTYDILDLLYHQW